MSREIFETRATYNICSDRLKVWFKTADRLPRPEYEQAKRIGFVWWPGSNCLTCVWRPDAQDFITSRGIEIEEDDQPDDTEARVERFTKYANNAEQSATGAADYLDSGRSNTDRRRRLALARAENETDRAGHWNRRIEAAIRHASFKERPDVIARRIEGLETDLRRHVASYTPHRSDDGRIVSNGEQVIVGPKGRGAHAVNLADIPKIEAYARRWTEHIEARLLYEQAVLGAAGGLQAQIASPEGVTFEVGGAVKAPRWARGSWLEITKVNPSTVEIYNPGCSWCKWRKLDTTEITEVATKLRVDAGEIPLIERAPVVERAKVQKVTARDGTRPEKFGAFGSSSTFHDDKTKPVERWWLITKVNAKTLEYLCPHRENLLQQDGSTKPRTVYYLKKEDIRTAGRFIDAATVKAEHPHLLEEFAALEAMRKRIAERKANASAMQPATAAVSQPSTVAA